MRDANFCNARRALDYSRRALIRAHGAWTSMRHANLIGMQCTKQSPQSLHRVLTKKCNARRKKNLHYALQAMHNAKICIVNISMRAAHCPKMQCAPRIDAMRAANIGCIAVLKSL
jgi:hypothetical protein